MIDDLTDDPHWTEEELETLRKLNITPLGIVKADGKIKPNEFVRGNNDSSIKEHYDEAGVRAVGLTNEEKKQAFELEANVSDAEFRASHPLFATMKNNWLKFFLGGAGLIGTIIALKCS